MKYKKFVTIRQALEYSKKKINNKIFQWLDTGVEDDFTKNQNFLDLQKIKLKPAHLNKIKDINLKTDFFGKKINSPIVLSPMGHQTQFHRDGEIEMCKGIKSSNTISFFSTQGRISLKDIRKRNPNALIGWTIFPFGDKKWIQRQIKDAESNKCLCIAICVDANVRSHRYRDREQFYDARNVGRRTNKISPDPDMAKTYGWELISFIKKNTKLPIIVKGILTNDDFKKCMKHKVDGVWISNHGGRMFNSGISTTEALKNLNKINFSKKIKIIADGGIMKGSDALKYLILGADIVGLGRPAIYGLICDGKIGVKRVFEIINKELETCMVNGGFKDYKKNLDRIFN